jgi:glutaredoxin-like protein NrdH
MAKKDIQYVSIDVSTNEAEAERLKELGYLEMPVVFGNGEYWTGYRPDKIEALLGAGGE